MEVIMFVSFVQIIVDMASGFVLDFALIA